MTARGENGRIEIDNNTVERGIRGIALNRQNALFAGSDEGASYYPSVYPLKIQSYFGLRRKNAVAGAIVGGRRRCTRLVA
jgi:transposase